MTEKAIILDDKAMARAIARMSYQIIERNKGVDNLVIIGILSRGAQIAERIARRIQEVEGKTVEVGLLDITAHRDDLHTGADYQDKSSIPFDFNDKTVVLVQLAVLIDRGHRELPIRPDYIGKNVPTSKNEQIQVFVTERDGIDKVSIL